MSPQEVEAILRAAGIRRRAAEVRPAGGGCINDAAWVELAGEGAAPRRVFLKSNRDAPAGMFEREAEGLRALAAVGAIRVPAPIATGTIGEIDYLLLEAVPPGRRGPNFWEWFGRSFAALHRRSSDPAAGFGFEHDNYLGSTPQPNRPVDDWVDFFRTRRLGFQLELARRQGLATDELSALGDRLLDRLDEWLGEPAEAPCLLHGDLWSGNFLVDGGGAPVLIDPACYRGRREADLAMTTLFGGFHRRFYDAYREAWPLEPGAVEREAVYQLYHVLNHLNLFGGGYRAQAVALLQRLAG